MKIINVGIAGLGRSGWNIHAALLEKMPETFKVVAVFDPIAERGAEAKERFGCDVCDQYDALIGNDTVDVVVVASPSPHHCEQTVSALEAGKAVVCEKPMATCVVDADRMMAAAEKTGNTLTVFQCCRYDLDFVKVKEVIDSGKLGRIVQIKMAWQNFGRRWDWQTLQECSGGSLNNTGPHMMDLALQFIDNKEPDRIFCHMDRALTLGDAEDHATIFMVTKGQPTLNLEISSACAYPEQAWLVKGTQGTLAGSRSSLAWKYIDPSALPERTLDKAPTADRSYNSETLEWIEASWGEKDDAGAYSSAAAALGKGAPFYEDLHALMTTGKVFPITLDSVRLQMAIFEECHRQSGFWGLGI